MTTDGLVELLAPVAWPTFVLVSARVVGLMLVAPLWSMAGIPATIRGAIAVALSLALVPTVRPVTLPPDFVAWPFPLAGELVLGLAIGLTGAFLMHGVALAGEVASLQIGLNLGQAISPMAEVGAEGLGELKSLAVLALFVTLGGHLALVRGLGESLQAIPPGTALDLPRGARAMVDMAGGVFATAVRAAAPLMVALLLANLGLAILARAVPQMSAMTVSFPITAAVGFVVFGASLPFLGRMVAGWTGGLDGRLAAVLAAFAPAAGR